MRCALVGAVDSTRVTLEALVDHGSAPLVLCTLPTNKAHLHSDFVDLSPLAANYGVPILPTPKSSAAEVLQELRELALDYIFVVGWSQICSPEFLAIPSAGVIGYHPAQLPKNRGRGVLPWTILQGASETGATIFWMNDGVDSGDVLVQHTFPVATDETVRSLYDKHMETLPRMWDEAIPLLLAQQAPRVPQDHLQATWCAKRTPVDGYIDWKDGAHTIWRLIRAVGDPYPGAFTFYQRRRLFVWEASYVGTAPFVGLPGQVQQISSDGVLVQCGDGEHIRLLQVQFEGEARNSPAGLLKMHRKLGIDWLDMVSTIANLAPR